MILILGVLVMVAVAVAGKMLSHRSRASLPPGSTTSDQSVCGKCGYIVLGLPTFTCPECGSDLREVGILRPAGVRTSNAGTPRFRDFPAPVRRPLLGRHALAIGAFAAVMAGTEWASTT
ncbi:MAG: hypothetical protein ABSH20_23450, partial [Tepidisphaeraceae bacterium]